MSDNKFNAATPVPAPIYPVTIAESPVDSTRNVDYTSAIKAYQEKFPNRKYWRPSMDVYSRDGFTVIGRDT